MSISLITGASGFIGSCLVERLVSQGETVRVLLRKESASSNLDGLNIEKVYADYQDIDSLKKALRGVSYVYHVAGAIKALNQDGYYNGNVLPTKNLLIAIKEAKISVKRFVHFSSLAASQPSNSKDYLVDEAAPYYPISQYGASKHEAENVCKEFMDSIPITIVRPSVVFGEKDTEMLKSFVSVAKGFLPILKGRNEKLLSFVYVQDLIDGVLLAAISDKSIGEMYFITDGTPHSYRTFCETIQKKLGKKFVINISLPDRIMFVVAFFVELMMKITKKPMILSYDKAREMRQDFWICSGEKAKRDFGFQSRYSLEEGIERTIAWARSAKHL